MKKFKLLIIALCLLLVAIVACACKPNNDKDDSTFSTSEKNTSGGDIMVPFDSNWAN